MPAIAAAVLLVQGCGTETRGWVLWEHEPAVLEAGAGCADCTYRFALPGLATTIEHGGAYGLRSVDVCQDDGVLVGYAGTIQQVPVLINGVDSIIDVIGILEPTCASISISANGDLVIAPTARPPLSGSDAGSPATWWQTCPAGEVVVGYEGHSGIFLDQVSFVCARASLTQTASGPMLTVSAGHTLTPAGGDGGVAFQELCSSGQIACGQSLRSEGWIDSFALICGTPSFIVQERDGGG
jgi:hypothetical protein